MAKNINTLKNILFYKGDYLGDEIANENFHTCSLKAYRVTGQSQFIRRSISKTNQCWCTCDNQEKAHKCACNCGMLFGVIQERAEKDAFTTIQARLLDYLTIQDMMMVPDLTANQLDKDIILEEAFKPMDGTAYRFIDRIIYY